MKVSELRPEMVDKISFDLRFYPRAPMSSGCYILTNIYEDILYIGQTRCLQRRMKEHLEDRRMTQRTQMGLASWFYYEAVPEKDLFPTEQQMLLEYKFNHTVWPPLNRIGP